MQRAKELAPELFTKSGLMVGLGETRDEILQVMDDLRSAGVDFLTIGQYLAPTRKHAEVKRYVPPAEFDELKRVALAKGFLVVAASPLTRSSYHAGEDFRRGCALPARGRARLRGPAACRASAPSAAFPSRRRRCSMSSPTSSAIPSSCRSCESLVVKSRERETPEGTVLIATMGVGYKAIRESFTTRVVLDAVPS